MTGTERGFLLLASCLGNPDRKPLTTAQLRVLADRVRSAPHSREDRELEMRDLTALGYGPAAARRILELLADEALLAQYLRRGNRAQCVPLTWASPDYPSVLRDRLADESPAVLWTKGDISLLSGPKLVLVGSRDIAPDNKAFAEEAGHQAALQGYTLVSGNARGADRIAQNACLRSGGGVISVVADELEKQPLGERILYISEEGFDGAFSSQRALSRNRVIHALADKTLVTQCGMETGGTWHGTVKNLRHGWSPVFCFADGTPAAEQLEQMGAVAIDRQALADISGLCGNYRTFF